MSDKKIGVLGCGMIAELGHLPALRHCQGLVPYAVYDVNWDRAVEMQRRFGVHHAYPTEEEFWESDIEAVVICTPAPLHKEHVIKAARFGKHILCEKPLAMNVDEILDMKAATEAADVMFFTGFTYRFSPSALQIRQLVRDRAIGEVRSLRLVYLWNLHGKWNWDSDGKMIPSPLRVGRMLEGGPMVDCGVHQIDLARWWTESPVEWQRGIGVWVEDFDAPDHMYLHMGHACGAHTMVEMSFSYNATSCEPRSHFQYELIGTDGVIQYNREKHLFELRNSRGTQHLHWHGEKNFGGMYSEFAHALWTGDQRDMPTVDDGLAATLISRQATEQAIRDREASSRTCPSSMVRAAASTKDIHPIVPLDILEIEELCDCEDDAFNFLPGV